MSIKQLIAALKEAVKWAEWERESLEDFHAYAHRFGGKPGGNVYMFTLRDALAMRGMTLDQFRAMRQESGRGNG
jgi:hypothetical protein